MGGVVQIFRYVWKEKIFVVDINSMYPAMLLKRMPWKFLGLVQDKAWLETLEEADSDFYLYEVKAF